MGADGNIIIYDYDKIVEEIGEEAVRELTDSTIYIQELNGKRYLTEYYGDNIDHRGSDWKDRSYFRNKNDPDYIPEAEWDRLWEIIRKHRVTEWEAWT